MVMILMQSLDTHGSNLSSHLQLIESLKSDLTEQKVSQILDSAQRLVDQFATLKTQLVSYFTWHLLKLRTDEISL